MKLPPPWAEGWRMQDGMEFTQALHVTMTGERGPLTEG